MGALSHLRVLDLSRVLAGPWASQVLADLGADVIKVEHPAGGDDTRAWGPPFAPAGPDGAAQSAYFLATNRGKRSVALDLGHPEARRLARELALGSDVVLENFKAGGLARYGLDYPTLSAANPRLVYCSVTGFGQTGPYRERAGYDFVIQAMGGLMSVTGEADGRPGAGPQKVGVAIADIMTGLYAAIAILAALAHRDRTGEGQHIDLALLDVQVATLANQATNYLVSSRPPGRLGNAHPNIVPYQSFAVADGHLVVAVGNDRQFGKLCEVMGLAELAGDPRFTTNRARVANREALTERLGPAFAARRLAEWLAVLEPAGVPCGPINTLDRVFADPQVLDRGMVVEVADGQSPPMRLVGSPLKLSATPVGYDRPPPRLGEHTDAVLSDRLGLAPADLAVLRRAGAIG